MQREYNLGELGQSMPSQYLLCRSEIGHSSTCRPSWNCTAACMASSSLSTLSFHVLLRCSHAEFTWKHDIMLVSHKIKPHEPSQRSCKWNFCSFLHGDKDNCLINMLLRVITYLVETFLYHGLIRFSTGCHELCTLILNCLQFLLQSINFLLKSL